MTDLLVCINDRWYVDPRYHGAIPIGFPMPEQGKVYTFAEKVPHVRNDNGDGYIKLAEFPREGCFLETHFRPVDDGSIDIFREIVTAPNKPLVDA